MRQVDPGPERILDRRRGSAARASKGVGSSRCMRKNGSKIWRIGWPKPSAVSCMRAVCHGKPQAQAGARRMRP